MADPTQLRPDEQLSEAQLQFSHLVFDPAISIGKQNGQFESRLATHWQRLDVALTIRFFYGKMSPFTPVIAFFGERRCLYD